MSSDNQFTAVGEPCGGFQTDGANIDRGADITGNQVGVQGRSGGPVGDGVQGFGTGNFSGVAGFGGGDTNSVGTGVFGLGGVQKGDLFVPQRGPGVRGIGGGAPDASPVGWRRRLWPRSLPSPRCRWPGGHGTSRRCSRIW